MNTKGKSEMEKIFGEEDIKGLEKEIDSAVDRLFIEKKRGLAESSLMESSISEPPYETGKGFEREGFSSSVSTSPPFLKPIEKMETQLLSLEWEITKENLGKTKEEVRTMKGIFRENPTVSSVLSQMEEVLNHMMIHEENIRPPVIKFLLDSKETIKLLMQKETDREISIYKNLAYSGIEARFSSLEGIREPKAKQPSSGVSGEGESVGISLMGEKKIEEILSRMNLFSGKMDEILKKIDRYLLIHEPPTQKPPEKLVETKPSAVNITIFKVDAKLFGVESDKVVKIFKVPSASCDKFSNQQKIRLKDFELRMIDLKKIFSIQGKDRKGEKQILTVKDNGEYKGLMIDQVLNKLSTHLDIAEGYGEYVAGMIRWTYQDHPVKIPILDIKQF